jgi:hypothetical protein
MAATYDPASTLREARKHYFAVNHFGDTGGYDDRWVHVKLGPVPFSLPNTAARVRAVKVHDLHHILTGYQTDIVGEFEISAWEIAAGCKNFYAAWVLNLSGITGGMLVAPRRITRAFARGLASSSLYGRPLDELLDLPVGEARARFVHPPEPPARLGGKGVAQLALATAAGVVIGTTMMIALLPLLPFGLLARQKAALKATPA